MSCLIAIHPIVVGDIPLITRNVNLIHYKASCGNHGYQVPVHLADVDIFHKISENVDLLRINKVARLHPLGTMNIATNIMAIYLVTFKDISLKAKNVNVLVALHERSRDQQNKNENILFYL